MSPTLAILLALAVKWQHMEWPKSSEQVSILARTVSDTGPCLYLSFREGRVVLFDIDAQYSKLARLSLSELVFDRWFGSGCNADSTIPQYLKRLRETIAELFGTLHWSYYSRASPPACSMQISAG